MDVSGYIGQCLRQEYYITWTLGVMFAEACEKAKEFTRPVVVSTRHHSGEVKAECASFMVLNREGWIVTAGHVYDSYVKFQQDQNKMREIQSLNESRMSRPGAPSGEIKQDPEFITNHSFWWGWDGVKLKDVFNNRQLDIAVGRLEPFNPDWVKSYPVFKDPGHMRIGSSLCKAGFPFVAFKSEFDEKSDSFKIPRIAVDETIFFNDGIYTRNILMGKTNDGMFDRRMVETSTPGLRGQSGGPVFDRDGMIYGMQVMTMHIPLGLHPTAEYDGRSIVENQFLNVGLGIHTKSILSVLDYRGVKYTMEGDETGYRITG